MVALGVLGEVVAWADGRAVDLGPARQRCVLAALLVEVNQVVPVERIIERVWGVHSPLRVKATLSSYVSRLRGTLAGVVEAEVRQRSGGYLLVADSSQIDLHEFRRLRDRARDLSGAGNDRTAVQVYTEALALWRGESLTGVHGDWAAAERDLLREERSAVECDLADARLSLGHAAELLTELAARAAQRPLDERVAAQYLLALYRSGRAAEALEHFQHLRVHLAEELGTDPCTGLQELHQRMLVADPALAVVPSCVRAHTVVVPQQLPASPALFVGRTEEVDRLDIALGDASTETADVGIFALVGAGGMGKTWLALHWAHRHAERFPDGQLFVDLRGFSPEGAPMDPAIAVRGFLAGLGVSPDQIPADPHARTALFRSLVAGRRMLIVADNAADTAQVAPLLPGTGTCTVLVTSRTHLSGLIVGHAARCLAVDVLSDAEARALFSVRLGAARVAEESAAVDDLIRMCGGFPLALSIVSGHAQARPRLPLTAVAAELRDLGLDALDDDDRAASLPTVLSWSYRALSRHQAISFSLLGIAAGPDISLHAAASLTGQSLPQTTTLLRGLEHASLLAQDVRGRFRMHDLIRAYAAATANRDLTEHQRRTALRRLVDFYVHTAHRANRAVHPHRPPIQLSRPEPGARPQTLPDETAAMAWFDAEHSCLLATQHAATTHHWHQAVWQLAWALVTYHLRRARHLDHVAVCRAGLAAAECLDDPTAHALAQRLLGNAYTRLGQPDEAVEHLHRALAVAEHHHDGVLLGHTHRALARAWLLKDTRQALEHATQALAIFRALGNPVWEAWAFTQAGWCAAQVGDHHLARAHCRAALTVFRRHPDPAGEANAWRSLGYVEHHTGHHERAIQHYQRALTLYRDVSDADLAIVLNGLGHPHAALGHRGQAHAAWCEALALFRRQGRDDEVERIRRQLDALGHTGATHPPQHDHRG